MPKYYRSESKYLDFKIFIRGKKDATILTTSYLYNFDEKFNSSHDHKISTILAYEKLSLYLNDEIKKLTNGEVPMHQ